MRRAARQPRSRDKHRATMPLLSVMALTIVPLFAVAHVFEVHAAEATAQLGGARVRYDDTRWQLSASSDQLLFYPLGALERDRDPVTLRLASDDASCTDLALNAFASGRYDTQSVKAAPVRMGGVTGERFAAHTGCRNATPQGVIICAKAGGRAYLLQSLNAGCSGRNLFSGIDPLDEIAGGIAF